MWLRVRNCGTWPTGCPFDRLFAHSSSQSEPSRRTLKNPYTERTEEALSITEFLCASLFSVSVKLCVQNGNFFSALLEGIDGLLNDRVFL